MRIITISREFGSGGREIGKRLAGQLGVDYYDKEIITAIAGKKGLDEDYVSDILEHHGWQNVPLTFCRSLTTVTVVRSVKADLLVEQTRVIESIAKAGKDCVIVGRNADELLRVHHPFNVFVCADMESKIRRCMERAEKTKICLEKNWNEKFAALTKTVPRFVKLLHIKAGEYIPPIT